MKICIIGGGGSVAVAVRNLVARLPEANIQVFTKRKVAGYRPCELTYVLGKQIPDFETMVNFDAKAMEAQQIYYHFQTAVQAINRQEKYLVTEAGQFPYDKLIIASGATPIMPDIPGMQGQGIYCLGTDMQYAQDLAQVIDHSQTALILGAGAIGLEVAEVLARRGYQRVIVVDQAERPLAKSLDPEIAQLVTSKLQALGIEFSFGTGISRIEDVGGKKRVFLPAGTVDVDFMLVAAGFRPNAELAQACGLTIGSTGGVKVNAHQQTSDPNIYAIGDVAEGLDVIGQRPTLAMKADNAVRTGKIAARHLAGETTAQFLGSVGGLILQLAEYFVGSVGYTEELAESYLSGPVKTVWHEGMSLPKYLGGQPVKIKLVYDPEKQLLLGAQMFSQANLAGELDKLALAMREGVPIPRISGTEVVYTPASGWPYGPVAQALDKCW